MKTIFRAVGPAFKQGLVVEPFESVNVYALLCELLGVTPEPHDGSLAAVKPMLRESRDPPPRPRDPPPPPAPGPPPPHLRRPPVPAALRRDSRGNSDTWRLPPLPLPPPSGGSGAPAGTGHRSPAPSPPAGVRRAPPPPHPASRSLRVLVSRPVLPAPVRGLGNRAGFVLTGRKRPPRAKLPTALSAQQQEMHSAEASKASSRGGGS